MAEAIPLAQVSQPSFKVSGIYSHGLFNSGNQATPPPFPLVSLDLLPVPLPSGSIQPGESARLPVWVRGSDTLGTSQHNLTVYYYTTSTTSKATPRMTSIPLALVSQPSLKVQCSRSGQLSHSNILGMQLVVHLFYDSARLLLLSFWNKLKEQVSHTDPQGAAEPT